MKHHENHTQQHEEHNHEHEKHDHQNHDHSKHHKNHDHSEHHAMMIKDFKLRFWISLVITLPVLLLSPLIQQIFNYSLNFSYSAETIFTLSTIIYFYGGWPFLTGLVKELKDKSPGMMTLIAVAISVAYLYSSATTFGLQGDTFFWELATLIDIMLLGHWLEMKSVMNASNSLQSLVKLMPKTANLLKNNETIEIGIDELNVNDKVLVKPGEKIPVDGIIEKGESDINESMITGESKPVKKKAGEHVIGGTINGNGSITIKTEQVGEDVYLNKVIDMVKNAQSKKSKTQNIADRIAFWLTIIALTLGAGTLITWLALGKPFVFALERMVSVMVITCPHALGLAVPLVISISTSVSASNGLLIRNRTAFENARKVNTIIFDKTGTLTFGNFGVSGIHSYVNHYKEKEILNLASGVESKSEHSIAAGILKKAKDDNIKIPEPTDFNSITGKGVEGTIKDKNIKVVSPGYLKEQNISTPVSDQDKNTGTLVYVLINDKLAGSIELSDQIRPESYDAVKKLQQNNIKCIMMTGDNESTARKVSEELKLDDYMSGMLPDDKLNEIKKLQDQGAYVAMTGDGINDAPALAAADVGIAVGSGTDVAADTADIVLVKSNPADIVKILEFGKATYQKLIQNFIWATSYNVVAIPLAAGVLFNRGILIDPAVGAALMSLSTIIVAINAQLLKAKINN